MKIQKNSGDPKFFLSYFATSSPPYKCYIFAHGAHWVASFHASIHQNTRYMNNKILRIFVSLLLKKGSCLTLMLDNIFRFTYSHWCIGILLVLT